MNAQCQFFRMCLGLVMLIAVGVGARAGQYLQDFSDYAPLTTTFTDGASLFCSHSAGARVDTDEYGSSNLRLVMNDSWNLGVQSAFLLPDLDPGQPVRGFTARWSAILAADFPDGADGFSVTFGQVAGLDLAGAGYAQETGFGTGVTFAVKTWSGANPGFYVLVNGTPVAFKAYEPVAQWGYYNLTPRQFEVDWDAETGMTVRLDGASVFAGVATPGFTPQAGDRLVWASRTGGLAQRLHLDDLDVLTRPSQYEQDFETFAAGDTTFADGAQLFGSALGTATKVVEEVNSLGGVNRTLRLTTAGVTGTRAAYLLPDLDAGRPVAAFSALWNMTVNGNFPAAADGFSLSFGPVGTLDLAGTDHPQESGYGVGLCLSVQTYGGNQPGFHLRVNGATVASQPYVPATQWGVNSSKRHLFQLDWDHADGLTVRLDGQPIFSNVPTPGFIPQRGGRFVWAARTGALTETIDLDNIVVVTGGRLAPATVGAPFIGSANNGGYEPARAFDGTLATYWVDGGLYAHDAFVGGKLTAAQSIRAYTVGAPEASLAWAPTQWTLEGSADGTAWTPAGTHGAQFLEAEQRAWLSSNALPLDQWRLNISASITGTSLKAVGEVALYAFTPADLPPPPEIETLPAENIQADRVTLRGSGVHHGGVVEFYFEWGTTTAYGNRTPSVPAGDLSFTLAGLTPGTAYRYRAVGRTPYDSVYGEDMEFTTASPFSEVGLSGVPNLLYGTVAWGDYDGDGFLDLFYAGLQGGPSWYWPTSGLLRNDPGAGFTRVALPVSEFGWDVGDAAWGDYDNDGRLDLIVVSEVPRLLHNDGGGNFTVVTIPGFPALTRWDSVAWGDFDNDGRQDLLIPAAPHVWRNLGGGQFVAQPILGMPSIQGAARWGDFNNDGNLDIALVGSGAADLWLNDGVGNFSRATATQLVPVGTGDALVGDYDADGELDLLMGGGGMGRAKYGPLWRSNGDGTFTQVSFPGWDLGYTGLDSPVGLDLGDLDGDGFAEFLVTGYYEWQWTYPPYAAGATAVSELWLNDQGGGFRRGWIPNLPVYSHGAIVSADYDQDGRLDFVTVGNQGPIRLFRNDASFSNQPPTAPAGLGSVAGPGYVTLSWGASTDDTTPSAGLSYNVRIGSAPGLSDVLDPMSFADGQRKVVDLGNRQLARAATYQLQPGTYYWSVQAIDASKAGGPFSVEHSFTVTSGPPRILGDPVAYLYARAVAIQSRVDFLGEPGQIWLEWGPTSALGSATPALDGGTTGVGAVTHWIHLLTPGSTYFYRTVTGNARGTVSGPIRSFTMPGDTSVNDVSTPADWVGPLTPGAPNVAAMTDNNISAQYATSDLSNAGLLVQPSGSLPIRALTIVTGENPPANDPGSVRVEGTFDGLVFTLLTEQALAPTPARWALRSIRFANAVAYPMYRVTFPTVSDPGNATGLQFGEIELLPYPEITSPGDQVTMTVTPGVSVSGTVNTMFDRSVAWVADRLAVDGNNYDETSHTFVPTWIVVELTPAKGSTILKRFELVGAGDDGLYTVRPVPDPIELWGSNDGVNYTLISTLRLSRSYGPSRSIYEFSLEANTQAFAQYRISLKHVPSVTHVGELRLFGEMEEPGLVVEQPAGTPLPSGGGSVDFGTVASGDHAVKTFTIRNGGASTLVLSGVSLTGGTAGDFTLDTTGMLTALPAGESTTFAVTLTPSGSGARSTTLRLESNDPEEPAFTLGLGGSGPPPPPTAARLGYFHAVLTSASATLSWGTLVEVATLGFHLERSRPDGSWERITSHIIPATGLNLRPEAYVHQDNGVFAASGLRYRLIEVDRRGVATVLAETAVGPVLTLACERTALGTNLRVLGTPGALVLVESGAVVTGPWLERWTTRLDAKGEARFPLSDASSPMGFYRASLADGF